MRSVHARENASESGGKETGAKQWGKTAVNLHVFRFFRSNCIFIERTEVATFAV